MACPTVAQFVEILRRESAETVARDYVLGGDVFIAQEYPRVLNTLWRHLCPRFDLNQHDVIIVGSAKMGFSLDPDAFPRQYSKYRDIDVLIVSETLFDRFWHTMLQWHYPRRLARLPNTDYPFFKGLVDRTADAGFQMKEVSADKGYLGASNMLATLQRGAIPYSIQVKLGA